MDDLPEHLIAGVPNGQESNYEISPWVVYQSQDSYIPLPYYFSTTSCPMAPSALLDPQLMPSQSLHTTPSAPTPRKTLTDEVRHRICLYHEENKSAKQVEIADLFGVERSTVSKILRQKEKYLTMPNGTQSPIKRRKHKEFDIEKALANWVQKSKHQGRVLTRNDVEEKAKLFVKNCATEDQKLKILTEGWLDKFLNENPIMCSSLENSADTVVSDGESTPPILPTGPPLCLSPSLGQGRKNEIGDSALNISGDLAKHGHSSTLDPINADLRSLGNTVQPPHLAPVTQDEARHALDLVINYVNSKLGSELPDQVSITLDELKERLNVVRNSIFGSHVGEDTDSLRMTKRRNSLT